MKTNLKDIRIVVIFGVFFSSLLVGLFSKYLETEKSADEIIRHQVRGLVFQSEIDSDILVHSFESQDDFLRYVGRSFEDSSIEVNDFCRGLGAEDSTQPHLESQITELSGSLKKLANLRFFRTITGVNKKGFIVGQNGKSLIVLEVRLIET